MLLCVTLQCILKNSSGGTVVEYQIVIPKVVRSRPSGVAFEIFQLCGSFLASGRIRSGVFYEASLK
jgi:hypothetical protein